MRAGYGFYVGTRIVAAIDHSQHPANLAQRETKIIAAAYESQAFLIRLII